MQRIRFFLPPNGGRERSVDEYPDFTPSAGRVWDANAARTVRQQRRRGVDAALLRLAADYEL